MKEKYFTQENITNKAKKIKQEAENCFHHHKFTFAKSNSALLVTDMQKFFGKTNSHAYIPSIETIIPNINDLIGAFKAHNLPVIFTKHVNTPENAGLMGEWWRDVILKNTEQSEFIEEIDTAEHIIIEKPQYDAFYNTELKDILRKFDINSLVITGVMAHLCCETTARSAFVRGFKSFFVVDATATYNEDFHRNTVMNLAHGFSVPVLTKEIAGKLSV